MKLTIILKLEIKKKTNKHEKQKRKKNKKKETWLKVYELTSAKKEYVTAYMESI